MCICVCKQSEKIIYGKGRSTCWVELKKDIRWIFFDWAFDVDRFGMCYRSIFCLVGGK